MEVVHERDFTNSDIVKMLKNQPSQPVLTPIPPVKVYSFVKTISLIEEYFGPHTESWPAPLQQIK